MAIVFVIPIDVKEIIRHKVLIWLSFATFHPLKLLLYASRKLEWILFEGVSRLLKRKPIGLLLDGII
jgi:hypothetical protein